MTSPIDERDEVSLEIAAPADRLYEIVSDVTRMGRLSPECTGGRWLGGATEPRVGARFVGFNRRGFAWWATFNRVIAAEPGREFAFETRESGTRWRYRFEPRGETTLVTEIREPWRPRPLPARFFARLLLGGVDAHDDEVREGMRATLERLRAVAEAETAPPASRTEPAS